MQKKLVDYVHLFVGEGMSVAQFDAMKRKVIHLEAENARLKNIIRRQVEKDNENPANLNFTRH